MEKRLSRIIRRKLEGKIKIENARASKQQIKKKSLGTFKIFKQKNYSMKVWKNE